MRDLQVAQVHDPARLGALATQTGKQQRAVVGRSSVPLIRRAACLCGEARRAHGTDAGSEKGQGWTVTRGSRQPAPARRGVAFRRPLVSR